MGIAETGTGTGRIPDRKLTGAAEACATAFFSAWGFVADTPERGTFLARHVFLFDGKDVDGDAVEQADVRNHEQAADSPAEPATSGRPAGRCT